MSLKGAKVTNSIPQEPANLRLVINIKGSNQEAVATVPIQPPQSSKRSNLPVQKQTKNKNGGSEKADRNFAIFKDLKL